MTLSQWIDDLDPGTAREAVLLVQRLGYGRLDDFPPLQIRLTGTVREEVAALKPYLGPVLPPPGLSGTEMAVSLVSLRFDTPPLLVVSAGFHREEAPQRIQTLAYTLALSDWHHRFMERIGRRSDRQTGQDLGFYTAAHVQACGFAFSRTLEEMARSGRKVNFPLVRLGWEVRLRSALETEGILAPQESERIKQMFLEAVVQSRFLGREGKDLWTPAKDNPDRQGSLLPLLDEGYGPAWTQAKDYFFAPLTFEKAWEDRPKIQRLLEALGNPSERKLEKSVGLTGICRDLGAQNRLDEAVEAGEEALKFLRTTPRIRELSQALCHLHAAYAKKGDWIQACRYYAEGREAAILADDLTALAQLAMNQAASDWPDPDLCLPKLLEALSAFNRAQNDAPRWAEGKASCLEQLASLYLCTGNQAKGMEYLMHLNNHKSLYKLD